ncbi:Malonate decarboxylase acyl carrier protein [Burkholderia cepacia]|nr:Malonate decarboxylase acyl carrier protein [Burkholderia cepacia]
MEQLNYRFTARERAKGELAAALVGVVASGNLEVLVERVLPGNECEIDIRTTRSVSARCGRPSSRISSSGARRAA